MVKRKYYRNASIILTVVSFISMGIPGIPLTYLAYKTILLILGEPSSYSIKEELWPAAILSSLIFSLLILPLASHIQNRFSFETHSEEILYVIIGLGIIGFATPLIYLLMLWN